MKFQRTASSGLTECLSRWAHPSLTLCLLGLLLVPAFLLTNKVTPDWPAFYAGGRLAGTHDLYSLPASTRITSAFMQPDLVWAFVRFPIYAAIIAPLSNLPPHTFLVAWQLLQWTLAVVAVGCFRFDWRVVAAA